MLTELICLLQKVLAALFAALLIGAVESFLYMRFFQRRAASTATTTSNKLEAAPTSQSITTQGFPSRPSHRRTKSSPSLPRYLPARTTSPLSGQRKPLPPSTTAYRLSGRPAVPNLLRRAAIEKHAQLSSSSTKLQRSASFPPPTAPLQRSASCHV